MSEFWFKGQEAIEAGRQLSDLIESRLNEGKPWIEDALEIAQRFDITSEEVEAFSRNVVKSEDNRRAARLVDLVESRLEGKPWTEGERKALIRFKITREEVDAEVRRRGGDGLR